jgi:hypothetical protein
MKIQGSPQLALCCLLFALPLAAKTCHRKEEPVPESLFLTGADSNLIPCWNQVPSFVQNFSLCTLVVSWEGRGGVFGIQFLLIIIPSQSRATIPSTLLSI